MCLVARLLHKTFDEIEETISLAEFYTHIIYERKHPHVDKLIASYVGFYEIENKRLEELNKKKIAQEMKNNSLQALKKEQLENQQFKKKDKNNEKIRI